MTVDIDDLKALIDLVAEERIDELQVTCAGVDDHVALRNAATGTQATPAKAARPGATAGRAAGAAGTADDRHTVEAPIPGTFYRAASAGQGPLVERGTRVQEGAVLGVIEAMKVFNEVSAILVEDGQPVVPGQAMFVIQTSI